MSAMMRCAAANVCRRQDGEGGRRERLRLLDLFLWLRHVALQASKGDGCFFLIQSEDRRRTPAGPGPPTLKVTYARLVVVV